MIEKGPGYFDANYNFFKETEGKKETEGTIDVEPGVETGFASGKGFALGNLDDAANEWTHLNDNNKNLIRDLEFIRARFQDFSQPRKKEIFERVVRLESSARPNPVVKFFRRLFRKTEGVEANNDVILELVDAIKKQANKNT